MKINETKQKLFRITTKRDIVFGRVSGSLGTSISSYEDQLNMLPYRPNLSSEERFRFKRELIEEIERLKEAHDVLTVVRCHSQPHLVENWFLKEREWRTEWDVPLQTVERAVNTVITVLEGYKSRTNSSSSRYEEGMQLLLELQAFRQAGEE